MFPPKPLDIVPPEGGCSEGLDAFRFLFKNLVGKILGKIKNFVQDFVTIKTGTRYFLKEKSERT